MRAKSLIAVLFLFLLVSCQGDKYNDEPVLAEHLGGASNKPFCEAVKVGYWLILSGQLGVDPETGRLAEGGIQAETRQTMENIKAT
ncbi:MAG: RidA family protein, partial [Candidatus Aminicenantes bacterium]|nr:RidA family protein [Candidatus Aminicenantes bacterium]